MFRSVRVFVLCAALFVSFGDGFGFDGVPLSRRRKGIFRLGGAKEVDAYLSAIDNVVGPKQKKPRRKKRKPKTLPSIELSAQLEYARNGHACTRNLVSPKVLQGIATSLTEHMHKNELRAWRQKVEVAADSESTSQSAERARTMAASCSSIQACREVLDKLLQEKAKPIPFLQFFNTWRTFPAVLELAHTLSPTACELMMGPRSSQTELRLYQDAVFWKRKGDGPTPWHSDAPMAPFDTQHMVTAWIPLHSVDAGLSFCSQSHSDIALPYWNRDEPKQDLSSRYTEPPVTYHSLALGDVTWHSGWTLHCADAAMADRKALAVTFVDALAPVRPNAEVTGDREDSESYEEWLSQVPRGKREWNHPLVPILRSA